MFLKKLALPCKIILGVASVAGVIISGIGLVKGTKLDKGTCEQIATSMREQEKAEKEAKKQKKNLKAEESK